MMAGRGTSAPGGWVRAMAAASRIRWRHRGRSGSGREMMKAMPGSREAPWVEYDATSALIVTDVQNDFAAPDGSLFVRGGEDVVPVANREIGRALGEGA